MTLKREIKDAYLEGGNSIYVKTHSNAVYVNDNETETLTKRLDNIKGKIDNNTTQLSENANEILKNFKDVNDYLGICSHDLSMTLAGKLKEYQFNRVRLDFEWEQIEKTAGIYDFSKYDEMVNNCVANNLKPLLILAFNNTLYASDVHSGILTDDNREKFVNFVRAAVSHYKNLNIDIDYEIWNEPYLNMFWTPQNEDTVLYYTKLVKAVYPVIKEISPKSSVLSPCVEIREWFEKACKLGILDYTDCISIHLYDSAIPETNYIDFIKDFIGISQNYCERKIPIIITETGYSTSNATGTAVVTEENRKKYLIRKILLGLIYGIDKIFLYVAHNSYTNVSDYEDCFGMFYSDTLEATSTVSLIKEIMSELKDCYFINRLNIANDCVYVLKFYNPIENKYKYIGWTTDKEELLYLDSAKITLDGIPKVIDIVENKESMYGNLYKYDSMLISNNMYNPGKVIDYTNSIEVFNLFGDNKNSGPFSHVEGRYNSNTEEASHVEGQSNICNSKFSHLEGFLNVSDGDYSHSEGRSNYVGNICHSEGNCNLAYNGYLYNITAYDSTKKTITVVSTTPASNVSNLKVGDKLIIKRSWDVAISVNIIAIDITNSILTLDSTPSSSWKYAIIPAENLYSANASGTNTIAVGSAAKSGGIDSIATGNYSFSHGEGCENYNNDQFVIGKFNSNKKDTIFEVGIGLNKNNRKNGFEVLNDGSIALYSPDGSRFKITVSNDGNLSSVKIS